MFTLDERVASQHVGGSNPSKLRRERARGLLAGPWTLNRKIRPLNLDFQARDPKL
jgi:hypothetical protein